MNVTLITPTPQTLVVNDDCVAAMRRMPDASIDSIVCDPPYGLSKAPDVAEVLRHWLAGDEYEHASTGFMNAAWDSFVPGPNVWRECLRVLKPGGHMCVFSSPRNVDLVGIAIRLAGFEIRDMIAWVTLQGFAHGQNVSKALDKVTPATALAQAYDGWASALKPGVEPILLCRKPLVGTLVENITQFGTGALNIDACRIPVTAADDARLGGAGSWSTSHAAKNVYAGGYAGVRVGSSPGGRYPANVVADCLCDVVHAGGDEPAVDRVGGPSQDRRYTDAGSTNFAAKPGKRRKTSKTFPVHTNPDCPCAELDRQSGVRKAGGNVKVDAPSKTGDTGLFGTYARVPYASIGDSGGVSRVFFQAKAKQHERWAWCQTGNVAFCVVNEVHNKHDVVRHNTVKPLPLVAWLVRLVTPLNGVVCDPFAGTFTTSAAALAQGIASIGIDKDALYCSIGQGRVNAVLPGGNHDNDRRDANNTSTDADTDADTDDAQGQTGDGPKIH